MHDNDTTERKRTTRMGLFLVGTFIVLMLVTNWMGQRYPAPQQPAFYYPDPTPYTVHTEVNIGSHNCIGWNVSC